jgi:hypothetical protein
MALIVLRNLISCFSFLLPCLVVRSALACYPAGYSFQDYSYDITTHHVQDGTAVIICPIGIHAAGCNSGGDMLRQNVDTGEVVLLSNTCSSWASDGTESSAEHMALCYTDECVPAGHYRYGYATSYACDSQGGCASYYFGEIEIQNPASWNCSRVHGTSVPTTFAGQVPWQSTALKCEGTAPVEDSGCSLSAARSRSALHWLGLTTIAAVVIYSQRRRRRPRGL